MQRKNGTQLIWIASVIAISIVLSIILVKGIIRTENFIALGAFWIFVMLVIRLGPETISEVTAGKLSIKRDVKAAREIRQDVKKIKNELRQVTKQIVESTYILANESFPTMTGEGKRVRNWRKIGRYCQNLLNQTRRKKNYGGKS